MNILRVRCRNIEEFEEHYLAELPHGGVFAPTTTELPVGAPGSQGTLGWRGSTTLSLTFSEVTVPIYVDVLGFATGPAFVALIAASPTQPIPVQTEQRLVSLLLSRALAHPL